MFSGWKFFKNVADKDAPKKLNKYVIYAKDTFNGDLGCLQYTQSAVDVSFDDFPKQWTSNVTSRPLKVTVEAASARDAMGMLMEKCPERYNPHSKHHLCSSEMRYADFAAYYEDGGFVGYYHLFKGTNVTLNMKAIIKETGKRIKVCPNYYPTIYKEI